MTDETTKKTPISQDTPLLALMRNQLLDAKRLLEKAKDEVDHGENDPVDVSFLVGAAFGHVMTALKISEE